MAPVPKHQKYFILERRKIRAKITIIHEQIEWKKIKFNDPTITNMDLYEYFWK